MKNGTYRVIDGVMHKKCTGPAHDEPAYLPATEKYFHVRRSSSKGGHLAGDLLSRCRLCVNWDKLKSPGSTAGLVDARDARPIYLEAVNRVGLMELARRSGISHNSIAAMLAGERRFVQKAKLRAVLLELISMRRHNEHSASRGAAHRTHARNNRGAELCAGCRTPLSNYTDGCDTCWNRRNGRERRNGGGGR